MFTSFWNLTNFFEFVGFVGFVGFSKLFNLVIAARPRKAAPLRGSAILWGRVTMRLPI